MADKGREASSGAPMSTCQRLPVALTVAMRPMMRSPTDGVYRVRRGVMERSLLVRERVPKRVEWMAVVVVGRVEEVVVVPWPLEVGEDG